jgi:hypothetical protein
MILEVGRVKGGKGSNVFPIGLFFTAITEPD